MFARHPVYDTIFSCLTPASFARISRVCRDIREGAVDFATRAYNINRRLGYYFSDPLAFRALMARTRFFISGSFALQFFDRTFYPGSDLDLYVQKALDVLEIGRWLEKEGYTYKPTVAQRATVDAQIKIRQAWGETEVYNGGLVVGDVLSFEKQVQDVSGTETRKVQLVVPSPRHRSPLETILNFHSTCVMNVITHDAAYSLYPYATFELNSSAVLTKDTSPRTTNALEKYVGRGFRMLDAKILSTNPKGDQTTFVVDLQRQVADEHSWIIPLSTNGLPRNEGTSSIAKYAWRFKKRYYNSNEYIVDYLGVPQPRYYRPSAYDECCCPTCAEWDEY
ncbi:hypothetical protein L226DRAFT_456156 [Lentinus tigrinus ALCF2SS1-7]|uniref:F-box domain-containing protein n=1 Tax=Lentinus tigrinus ALCF2SS1-6 TaxID=1328759 RepID=A0A5C2SNA7_9APHY|nr:hypothetical protein L227DRAFT_493608 [Lentinus tigrinus ALCF2SS1-6]RPD79307.1 hypothetical protein L226DRAFT_456156 [Lentinus tigrinus ALCF2SS1-7]